MNETDAALHEAPERGSATQSARHWLQFRLRTLLFVIVAVCLVLGGWHLSVRPFVSAGPAVVGKPFMVRGRFVDVLGFESEVYIVQVSKLHTNGKPVICQSGSGKTERRALCAYDVEIELAPISAPGEYDVEIHALTKAVHARKTSMQARAVRGKLVVKAAD